MSSQALVDLVRQDGKRVPHVDDLIETGAEKIVMPRFLLLFRSHPIPQNQCLEGITLDRIMNPKSQENDRKKQGFLQIPLLQISENARQIIVVRALHGGLI